MHRTPEPEWNAFSRSVSRESVRIELSFADLNDLTACSCDIQSAYLQSPFSVKYYVVCGPKFVLENVGKHVIIVRTLYGGKPSGSNYWRHARSTMK